jgi:hypothetical protein
MNDFQKKAINAVTEATASPTIPHLEFTHVHGKKEDYFTATAVRSGESFKIFVYKHEAGCMKNDTEWTIFERPDFATEEALIERFVAHVKAALAGVAPPA